jgi:hypothetical protein
VFEAVAHNVELLTKAAALAALTLIYVLNFKKCTSASLLQLSRYFGKQLLVEGYHDYISIFRK